MLRETLPDASAPIGVRGWPRGPSELSSGKTPGRPINAITIRSCWCPCDSDKRCSRPHPWLMRAGYEFPPDQIRAQRDHPLGAWWRRSSRTGFLTPR